MMCTFAPGRVVPVISNGAVTWAPFAGEVTERGSDAPPDAGPTGPCALAGTAGAAVPPDGATEAAGAPGGVGEAAGVPGGAGAGASGSVPFMNSSGRESVHSGVAGPPVDPQIVAATTPSGRTQSVFGNWAVTGFINDAQI